MRRLYPGEEGAGDIQTETAALHARLDAVLDKPGAIFGLWNQARDAAADAYIKASRKQRENMDLEEVKLKRAMSPRAAITVES